MTETKKDELVILHLSDLHIGLDDSVTQETTFDALTECILEDSKKRSITPEVMVVTGDIVKEGKVEEYIKAQEVLKELYSKLNIKPESIFIVPGNHDVDQDAIDDELKPLGSPAELRNLLVDETFRLEQLEPMKNYFAFIKENYPHLIPYKNGLIPFVNTYKARSGKQIGFLGLNSAWMCEKTISGDEGNLCLGEFQVNRAYKALREKEKQDQLVLDQIVCLFHHPLSFLSPEDMKRYKRKFKTNIILSGHLHQTSGGYSNPVDSDGFYDFQAGASYNTNNKDWPERFHYMTLDWARNEIRLDFRKFDTISPHWFLDAELADNGRKTYPHAFSQKPDRVVVEDEKKLSTDEKRESLEIKKLVSKNISKILEKVELNEFKNDLSKQLGKNKREGKILGTEKITSGLMSQDVLAAVLSVDLATRQFLQRGAGEENPQRVKAVVQKAWIDIESILGWLVLRSVEDKWFSSKKILLEKNPSIELTIPEKNDASVAILTSSLGKRKAVFGFDDRTENITDNLRIDLTNIEEIEGGYEEEKHKEDLVLAIWRTLCKGEPNPRNLEENCLRLNHRLKIQKEKNNAYYVAFDLSKATIKKDKDRLHRSISSLLQQLQVVFFNIDDEQGLLVHEGLLMDSLIEFLNNKKLIEEM